jgi:excinuclease ABC subunit C
MLSSDSIKEFPQKPGVYLFKDKSGKIIYIGKAKNLQKRINSYFTQGSNQSRKLAYIIRNAQRIDHIITGTETEALILEGNLIKKYRPRYNVDLKDDANYPFVKLDIKKRYPRLTIVRRMRNDGALYFGPFPSVSEVRSTLHLIGPIFPLRKCTTKEIPKRSRPCLNHQLGRCLAPCCMDVSQEDYQELVDQVRLFLEGRNKELVSKLKNVMENASRELNFEKAAMVRDQIRAIEKTVEKQTVVSSKMKDQDIIGLSYSGKEAEVVILLVRGGSMVGTRSYSIRGAWEHSSEILEAFLKQYYREKQFFPPDIILSDAIDDRKLISEWLTGMAGKKVSISVPSKGDKRRLAHMAAVNADNILLRRQKTHESALLEEAKSLLHLRSKPVHIEAIDVSNLKGDLAVASIVAFVRGLPQKSGYRNYRIKEVEGIDDYAMIAEGMKRRLKHGKPPDLFVIDGGKGHLAVALKTLGALGLENPPDVISIAKADRERPGALDKIYLPNRKNPLNLARNHPVLSLFMRIRDETHRRAVSYYRKRRKKKLTRSELDRIPGIGPKRKKLLLKHFGDLQSVVNAAFTELTEVPGINQSVAKNILNYFHSEPQDKAGQHGGAPL